VVVVGDVTQPECGVHGELLRRLRGGVSAFWHFAASLAYEDAAEDEIARHNVGGVKNAIACARAVEASRYVHVSTAYTAGRLCGVIPEALHGPDTVFNNAYERTKAEAERMVVDELTRAGVDYRIVRPSIVIGPSQTHDMGGSGTGIYGFIRELKRARRVLNFGAAVHVVAGDPDVELNLIPVDHVVEGMLRVAAGELPERRVLHLTNPRGPRLGDALALGCELAAVRPIRLVPGHEPTTAIERRLAERFEFYSYYFRDQKSFARSLSTELRLSSMASLRPYVERALRTKDGDASRVTRAAS
jgi:nucleoside-diphosphate-sugar epimerase